eukprot:6202422-Pleurochrysis_carterae.AAC.2
MMQELSETTLLSLWPNLYQSTISIYQSTQIIESGRIRMDNCHPLGVISTLFSIGLAARCRSVLVAA